MYLELVTALLRIAEDLIRFFTYRIPPRMFSLPSFPITCNIWRNLGAGGAYGAPDVAGVPCNLAVGSRITGQVVTTVGTNAFVKLVILLPPLTDVRQHSNSSTSDLIECPAGSKRFYIVVTVDDYGKGFANEHRFAVLTQEIANTHFGFNWPTPLP